MLRSIRAAPCVLAVLLWTSAVFAQDVAGPVEQARQLFQEGLDLADAGDWERAVQRFRGALELRESAPIRYNLARSLASMGRLVEALVEVDRVVADSSAGAEVHGAARQLRAEAEPRLGRLVVEVRGDAEGTHVTIDGRPLPSESLGEPTPVDPGVRVARLMRGTEELDLAEVDIPEGGSTHMMLESPARVLAAVGHEAPAAASDDGWVWPVAIVAALVAAGAAVLIGFLVADASGPQPSMGDFLPAVLEFD
jgi:hypothetical protein